jgi:hypothetical protein
MPTIESGSRRIAKATYVALKVDNPPDTHEAPGNALAKNTHVQMMRLQTGDVEAVKGLLKQKTSKRENATIHGGSKLLQLLEKYEGQPLQSSLPPASVFAPIPSSDIIEFGKALSSVREQQLSRIQSQAEAKVKGSEVTQAPVQVSDRLYAATGFALNPSLEVANAVGLLNSANLAVKSLERHVTATPIGMLHLERIEMTPAGIERGELIATIPLAPGEKTAVVQKEWSVTSKEFTTIVTDTLENFSETGVTENNELAQATNSQTQHSSEFSINASVSGTYGMVTASAAASYGLKDSSNISAQESKKHAASVTKKASTRVTQEHKTTISTKTVTGTSEESTRILENKDLVNPIRIDYFSLMRKWRVRLYRYGLRMTYDLVVPEPGANFRKLYAELASWKAELGNAFELSLSRSDISPDRLDALQKRFGVPLPLPPAAASPAQRVNVPTGGLSDDDSSWHFYHASLPVTEGYEVESILISVRANSNKAAGDGTARIYVQGTTFNREKNAPSNTLSYDEVLKNLKGTNFLEGSQTSANISIFIQHSGVANIDFVIEVRPTARTIDNWVSAVWNACYNAAQNQHYANQQVISAKISQLEDEINNVDTLTLRREENDELIRAALIWLLGPSFQFMPESVKAVFEKNNPISFGTSFTDNGLGTKFRQGDWDAIKTHGDVVKFINEAVEWESMLYFPYSYFWDVPSSWDFIRRLKHSDKTRQRFLRAGGARVVLPIRKDYEEAWLHFVNNADPDFKVPYTGPYLSIAKEIQAFDNTNYPGIPPANPGASPVEPGDTVATRCKAKLSVSTKPFAIEVENSDGFVVGGRAIIDGYDSGNQEYQLITGVPDKTHIEVQRLDNPHDGTKNSFSIILAGEAGLLIGEWHEYTPSSGVDIAVTSNLTTIA